VLVVQKEVGQRICARPPRMNLLAVSVQFYAEPKIISYISKKSFWPQPEVDAAVIKITSRQQSQISAIAEIYDRQKSQRLNELFFKIVKAGFSHPRKQILNNLRQGLVLNPPKKVKLNKEKIKSWLKKSSIRPEQRAETLSVKDWIKLTENFNEL